MQTNLADWVKDTPEGAEANAILRKCVHCGFCLATCPTYNLLGDELDSPRGRIYLIKQMLEGAPVTERTQLHLDRCLTCRSCETTCPSGVQYGRLVDIGRDIVERAVPRKPAEAAKRALLRKALPKTGLFRLGLFAGRLAKPFLKESLAQKLPKPREAGVWPKGTHARRMLVLDGCVQPAMAPDINAALARVLDRAGIALVRAPAAGCCGAIAQHLNNTHEARDFVRRNIDAWWPYIEQGAEAIVVTASGCGTMVADYEHLLQNDPPYAEKAARVSALFRDTVQVVSAEWERLKPRLRTEPPALPKVAFHSPCSLQHGLQIKGAVEPLLEAAGYQLTPVPDGHLCCGSAGTYSLLQPELSQQLLANKVAALASGSPHRVATANIGCLAHIESGMRDSARLSVAHWIELIDLRLQ